MDILLAGKDNYSGHGLLDCTSPAPFCLDDSFESDDSCSTARFVLIETTENTQTLR